MNRYLVLLLAGYAIVASVRLFAWRNDLSVWTAAAHSDADDPWALNNTAHLLHTEYHADDRAQPYWHRLMRLSIPTWLPAQERQAYVIGYINYSEMLRAYGKPAEASALTEYAVTMAPAVFGR